MTYEITGGKETRITLEGKMDFANAPKLLKELEALKGNDISAIVFECGELEYVSSAGIRVFLFAHQKITQVIKMKNVCEDVMEVLEMCGLADFIEFI